MPTGPARTADDIAETIRTLIDRMVDAKFTQELAKRGHDVAGSTVGSIRRRGVARHRGRCGATPRKSLAHASRRRREVVGSTGASRCRPVLKDLWKRRTVADGRRRRRGSGRRSRRSTTPRPARPAGARGAALGRLLPRPAGRRGGRARSWRCSPTPKRGSEMRDELGDARRGDGHEGQGRVGPDLPARDERTPATVPGRAARSRRAGGRSPASRPEAAADAGDGSPEIAGDAGRIARRPRRSTTPTTRSIASHPPSSVPETREEPGPSGPAFCPRRASAGSALARGLRAERKRPQMPCGSPRLAVAARSHPSVARRCSPAGSRSPPWPSSFGSTAASASAARRRSGLRVDRVRPLRLLRPRRRPRRRRRRRRRRPAWRRASARGFGFGAACDRRRPSRRARTRRFGFSSGSAARSARRRRGSIPSSARVAASASSKVYSRSASSAVELAEVVELLPADLLVAGARRGAGRRRLLAARSAAAATTAAAAAAAGFLAALGGRVGRGDRPPAAARPAAPPTALRCARRASPTRRASATRGRCRGPPVLIAASAAAATDGRGLAEAELGRDLLGRHLRRAHAGARGTSLAPSG